MISKELVKKVQNLYLDQYQIKLTTKEAGKLARDLVSLTRETVKTLSKRSN